MLPLFLGGKMKLSAFREDPKKQKGGAPIFIGDGVFYVRRWGTPESQDFLKQLRKNLFGPLHKDQTGDENLLVAEWLIEYGVTGWDGVLQESADDDQQYKWYEFFHQWRSVFGKRKIEKPEVSELPYSKAAARNIFGNPEYYISLNNLILSGAMNFENYLYDDAAEDLEAIKKN